MEYQKHFIPLESDPIIFTDLMHGLGVSEAFEFIDVWSIEADQLSDIRSTTQRPIEALILILPECPAYAEQGSKATPAGGDIIWLGQTINNACGLYAILHCVCNTIDAQYLGMLLFWPEL